MCGGEKVKLDGLEGNCLSDVCGGCDGNKVRVRVSKDKGLNGDSRESLDLGEVWGSKGGRMSGKDKVELDRMCSGKFGVGGVSGNESSVGIGGSKRVVEDGRVEENGIRLGGCSREKGGVESGGDKKVFDCIGDNIIMLCGDKGVEVGEERSDVSLSDNLCCKKEEGIYSDEGEDYKSSYMGGGSREKGGVMRGEDKVNVDERLGNGIGEEVEEGKDGMEGLEGK